MAQKIKPDLTGINTKVPLPNFPKSGRGGSAIYPFASLEVENSFGVKNRTANQMASTISGANKRNMVPEMKDGKPVLTETKDETGKVVGTSEKMVATKTFKVMNVDPKKDPDGATCRIWRIT